MAEQWDIQKVKNEFSENRNKIQTKRKIMKNSIFLIEKFFAMILFTISIWKIQFDLKLSFT